jgi:hypothetical protein
LFTRNDNIIATILNANNAMERMKGDKPEKVGEIRPHRPG